MATFHGKSGTVAFGDIGDIDGTPTAVDNITDWSLSITVGTAEADVMGEDAIVSHAGHYTWTASVSAFLDSTAGIVAIKDLAAAELILKAKSDVTFTGDAICDSANPGAPVAGIATVNYTFKGSGEITQS